MSDAFYQWFVDEPGRYWLIAIPFGLGFLAAAAIPRRIPAWVFLAALGAFLVAFRWPVLVIGLESSVDESQMISGAITLQSRPVFWRDVDTHAAGPLTIYPIAALGWLGLPLNFATARVFGLFLEWLSFAAIFLLLRDYFGDVWARLGVLPPAVFVGLSRYWDFVHYASEGVANALVAIGTCAVWTGYRRGSVPLLAAGGAALSATAWAKLQALPIAFVVALGVLVAIALSGEPVPRRRRLALAFCSSAALALLVPLVGIALGGLWSDWANGYLRAGLDYVGRPESSRLELLWSFASETGTGFPVFAIPVVLATLGLLYPAMRSAPGTRAMLGTLALAVVAALVVIVMPGRHYNHYLLLGVVPFGIAAAACAGALFAAKGPAPLSTVRRLVPAVAYFAVTVVPQVVFAYSSTEYRFDFYTGDNHLTVNKAARAIQANASAGDTMCVWGWQPNLYVMTGLTQATREAHTEREISDNPLRDFYRARFLADFERAKPRFFVDAITPDNFMFNNRDLHGFHLWPEFGKMIALDYALGAEIEGCRIYVRISRAGGSP